MNTFAEHIVLGGRLLLGIVFLWAGLVKVFDPFTFFDAVLAYELLSRPAAVAAAAFVPWVEVAVGVVLVAGRLVPHALLAAGVLLAVFVGAQVHVVVNGLNVPCACFGGDAPVDYRSVTRTGVLLALGIGSLACAWTGRRIADVADEADVDAGATRVPQPAA